MYEIRNLEQLKIYCEGDIIPQSLCEYIKNVFIKSRSVLKANRIRIILDSERFDFPGYDLKWKRNLQLKNAKFIERFLISGGKASNAILLINEDK